MLDYYKQMIAYYPLIESSQSVSFDNSIFERTVNLVVSTGLYWDFQSRGSITSGMNFVDEDLEFTGSVTKDKALYFKSSNGNV